MANRRVRSKKATGDVAGTEEPRGGPQEDMGAAKGVQDQTQKDAPAAAQPKKGLVRVTARDKRRAAAAEARRLAAGQAPLGEAAPGLAPPTKAHKRQKAKEAKQAAARAAIAQEALAAYAAGRSMEVSPATAPVEEEREEEEGASHRDPAPEGTNGGGADIDEAEDAEEAPKKRKRKRKRKAGDEAAPAEAAGTSAEITSAPAAAPGQKPVADAPPPRPRAAGPTKKPKLTPEVAKELEEAEAAAGAEIYVQNFSYEATEADMKAFFEPSGTVAEVRMPRYQDSGKPMGYCHVAFRSAAAADRAVTQNGAHMMGRILKVEKARGSRVLVQSLRGERPMRPPGCKMIFVKNLPYHTTEDEVREAFMVCGKVMDVRLARHNDTGNLKGFGYVEFLTGEAAEVAVNKLNMRVGGRVVLVDYEQGKPKASFKRTDGRAWKRGGHALGRSPFFKY